MYEAVQMFHTMWDHFPGIARLIDKDHNIIAANTAAEAAGFLPGCKCSKCVSPQSHRLCKHSAMFAENRPIMDTVIPGRIRGWMPVEGHPDLCVHFTIVIPQE